jgi:hypothetical protein
MHLGKEGAIGKLIQDAVKKELEVTIVDKTHIRWIKLIPCRLIVGLDLFKRLGARKIDLL